ncbi:MAG: phospho-N-acetylmuramoyl-pentapeptide-transferase [Pirellulales bacterium]
MYFWLQEHSQHFASVTGEAPARITLRTLLAAICSFVLAVILGPWIIRWLQTRYREPNVSDCKQLEQLHSSKQWTPTMGGLFITAGIVAATLLLGDLGNPYLPAAVVLTLGLCVVGYWDDWRKLTFGRGLSARAKLAAQFVVASAVVAMIYSTQQSTPHGLELIIPFSGTTIPLGVWFIPLSIVVILGSSNAVNLTDGLDGLACGCLVFALAAMGSLVYVAGHTEWATHLSVPKISGAGELTIVTAAAIGAILGFLWFNCHPAQVFMGDTGSLPLGGLLGFLAIVARQELLLIVIGGVFVAEALSVLLQVGYYRWRQRRIFRCAPLHHHFQLIGWSESKIVVRFWIAAALCAILGLAALSGNPRKPMTNDFNPSSVISHQLSVVNGR